MEGTEKEDADDEEDDERDKRWSWMMERKKNGDAIQKKQQN